MPGILENRAWSEIRNDLLEKKDGFENLVLSLFARIEATEPFLQAWVCLDKAGALNTARKLDQTKRKSGRLPPLLGMPVGIKDIFDVRGFPTGAGIEGWSNTLSPMDSPIVGRLRDAGVIILGKTVTTALACFDPPATKNPWNEQHTPGGSSSGSAAALACSLVAGALGSQTGGSLCRPASYCGVCAMKPTFGLLPTQGILPVSFDLDHPGPMARNTADLTDLFHVLSNSPSKPGPFPSIILGIPQGMFALESTPIVRDHFARCRSKLTQQRITFTEVPVPESFGEIFADHFTLMAHGAWLTHRERFLKEPRLFPPKVTELIEKGGEVTPNQVDQARAASFGWRTKLIGLMRDQDAWLLPGFHDFPPDPDSTGVPRFHAPWSFLGWPEISFSTDLAVNGLPIGLQLVGRPHSDARLLQIAQKIQNFLGHPPLPAR